MSSREIAELTGKRHDNVMANIPKTFAEALRLAADQAEQLAAQASL